jgi:PadR family transcriptional regulator, regulatory protein PadR
VSELWTDRAIPRLTPANQSGASSKRRRRTAGGMAPDGANYYYDEVYNDAMPSTDALGEFEQCLLLAIVHLGERAYGVAIREEVEERTGREVAVGALYTSLGRLERKGYVRSVMADPTPERGGRSKRFFTIRAAGAAALRQSRQRLERMWRGLTPTLRRAGQ